MSKIIITTEEELEIIIKKTLTAALENRAGTTTDSEDVYLTLKEAAEFLKMSQKTLYRIIREREIPFIKRGKIYFSKQALKDWLLSAEKKSKTQIINEQKGGTYGTNYANK